MQSSGARIRRSVGRGFGGGAHIQECGGFVIFGFGARIRMHSQPVGDAMRGFGNGGGSSRMVSQSQQFAFEEDGDFAVFVAI